MKVHGYFGNTSDAVPSFGESANNIYLLAKRIALERQRPMSGTNPFWAGRDTPSIGPNLECVQDSPIPQSNLLSLIADNPCDQRLSQTADLCLS